MQSAITSGKLTFNHFYRKQLWDKYLAQGFIEMLFAGAGIEPITYLTATVISHKSVCTCGIAQKLKTLWFCRRDR